MKPDLDARRGRIRRLARAPARLASRTVALLLLASLTAPDMAARAESGSSALWTVVSACRTAQQTLGTSFPCIAIRISTQGRQVALLRPHAKNLLVVPLARMEGLESPDFSGPVAADLLDLAWSARDQVGRAGAGAGAVAQALPWDATGLMINAARGRSQDQLHIHVGCLTRRALTLLKAVAPLAAKSWSPVPLETGLWARTLPGPSLQGADPIGLVRRASPMATLSPRQVSVGIVGTQDRAGRRGFMVLATATVSLESLLDPACQVAKPSAARR